MRIRQNASHRCGILTCSIDFAMVDHAFWRDDVVRHEGNSVV
jgi:hypothetical protein